jgi:hypothetical protein
MFSISVIMIVVMNMLTKLVYLAKIVAFPAVANPAAGTLFSCGAQ